MSNTNYQFPPSSPLHDAAEVLHNKDPFALAKKPQPLVEGKDARASRIVELPTPNPSSSLFRSSSPAREEIAANRNEFMSNWQNKPHESKYKQPAVAINKNFNILKSDNSVLRIPFLSSQYEFSIGRSSQTCQYNLNSKDSYISRTHVKINYNPQHMIINCIGSNGMGVVIPKTCFVYAKPQNKNEYIVVENTSGQPLSTTALKNNFNSIKLTAEYSQFYIHKGELVSLPRRFENVLLEISKLMVLLNPKDVEEPLTDNDEELTDDEELVLINNSHAKDKGTTDHDLTPLNKIFSSSVPQTPSKPKNDSTAIMKSSPQRGEEEEEEEAMDSILNDDDYQTPSKQHPVKLRQPQPNKTVQFNIYSNNNESSPHKRSLSNPLKMVLSDVTNTNTFRRASSAEPHSEKLSSMTNNYDQGKQRSDEDSKRPTNESQPPTKKRKRASTRQQTPELDNSALSLPNLSEIENILVNHLAFSRLSSTPASFLNTISATTSKLSLLQIRSILHNLKCIGIIYRQGKDAAGKPLEEEYYYMPEQDDDQGRQSLVSNVKGHGGLRSCRRTHKQYYWKKPAPIKK